MKKYMPIRIVLLLFFTFFHSQLIAQEVEKIDTTKFKIQEVIVVGTRTTEKIIDIPYSVFRVDKKELVYGKKVSAKDVLADVPGLFLQNRYGNHDLRISIRGFGTRSNSGVRGVRILQDGIPESEPDGETVIDAIDFTSLGGVEVVKGNLSSLYANAPGGVINFVSDIYFPDDYLASYNQIGRFGYRQNGFKLGLKNNDNKLLVTYNYGNLDGYREHSNEYHHLLNSIYESFIGTKSTLSIHLNFVNSLIKIPGSLTKEEFDTDPFMADPLAVSQDYKRITKKGRVAAKFITHFGNLEQNELEFIGYGGIKELDKADNEFYQLTTRYSVGGFIRFSNRTEFFNRKNILTIGSDYAFQSGPITQFDNISGARGISVQNQYNESLSNIGFYLLDHFTILEENLDLFISSRFDKNDFSRDIFIPYGFTDSSRTMSGFAPKVGINYKLTPSIALYSSFGLSFDYPALSELSNNPLSSNIQYTLNPDLNAQKSNNFELGIKGNILNKESEFMKKLFFEVTYFNYLIRDEIVPFIINLKTYYRNAARTRRTGVEIGMASEPYEKVDLIINYTLTNFYFENYIATVFGPSGTTTEDYTNNKVPSVPTSIFNFILEKEFEFTENISGLIIFDCDYIADMFVNDANTEINAGYFYANFMLGSTLDYSNFTLTAFFGMNNVFDKRYSSFINLNEFNGRYYETGDPRTYYSGINFKLKI